MIDPLAQYDLSKLRMREAQEYARQRALMRMAPGTTGGLLLGAIARLRSSPGLASYLRVLRGFGRRTPVKAARLQVERAASVACVDAECCMAC